MKQLLLFMGALALAGCTSDLGKFTVYSPRALDLSKGEYTVDKSTTIKGVDEANIYLVFPSNVPQYDQAVRNAMATKPGCVGIADLTLRRETFWLLFGYCDFIAEGHPIVRKEAK